MKQCYTPTPLLWIILFIFSNIFQGNAGTYRSFSDSVILQTDNIHSPTSVSSFYQSRGHKPAWTKKGKYSIKAYRLIQILNHAQYYGLNPENYHLKEILALKDAPTSEKNTGRMETLLTDSFIAFGHHLKYGQLNRETLEINHHLMEGNRLDIHFFENALNAPSLRAELERLEPSHPHYGKLKETLFTKLEAYNNNTLWAGKKNEELRQDILKLALNMERWRWEDKDFEDRHVFVNLPSYKLEVWENGAVSLESKIIVGSARHKTSVHDSGIEKLIVHPNLVPKEKVAEELLPIITKDPTFLSSNGYEVLDGNEPLDISTIAWETYEEDDFPYVVRNNDPIHTSMALIRFDIDSTGVWHDAESNSLFYRNVRALSGGCIILEKARDLAIYLVNDGPEITPNQVEDYVKGNEYKEIPVQRPLPVYIRYFTADGSEIYADIYDEDNSLMAYFSNMVKKNKDDFNLQRIR